MSIFKARNPKGFIFFLQKRRARFIAHSAQKENKYYFDFARKLLWLIMTTVGVGKNVAFGSRIQLRSSLTSFISGWILMQQLRCDWRRQDFQNSSKSNENSILDDVTTNILANRLDCAGAVVNLIMQMLLESVNQRAPERGLISEDQ